MHESIIQPFERIHPAGDPCEPAGTQLAIPGESGVLSPAIDLDFTPEQINMLATTVPTHTLLVTNGADGPNMVYALDKSNGDIIAVVPLHPSLSRSVGGSYHASRNTFFTLDRFTGLVNEHDLSAGSLINTFPVGPNFTIGGGDIDVFQATGNLFLVSDEQDRIREFTPDGVLVHDWDVSPIGITGMSGIDFDDSRPGEAWIITNAAGGPAFRVFLPEPSTALLLASGLAGLCLCRFLRHEASIGERLAARDAA